MNTEQQRQQAENRRESAESQRQDGEKQRNVSENTRQMAEKQREIGEQLREVERTSERLTAEYSTRALLERIESLEEQLTQCTAQFVCVEALLHSMQEQLQQLTSDKDSNG